MWDLQMLTRETPDLIASTPWPANSLDLSPVDYQIWVKLQERVYRSRIHDVAQLQSRLIEEWEHFNQISTVYRILEGELSAISLANYFLLGKFVYRVAPKNCTFPIA